MPDNPSSWGAVSMDAMPYATTAEGDSPLFYARGYCGTGVSAATHMGRRLVGRIGGGESILPVLDSTLPRLPLAAFRRLGQAAAFR